MARSAQEGRRGERHPVESKASPSDIKEGAGEEGKERELQVQRDQPHPRGFENQASGGKNGVVWPLGHLNQLWILLQNCGWGTLRTDP